MGKVGGRASPTGGREVSDLQRAIDAVERQWQKDRDALAVAQAMIAQLTEERDGLKIQVMNLNSMVLFEEKKRAKAEVELAELRGIAQ